MLYYHTNNLIYYITISTNIGPLVQNSYHLTKEPQCGNCTTNHSPCCGVVDNDVLALKYIPLIIALESPVFRLSIALYIILYGVIRTISIRAFPSVLHDYFIALRPQEIIYIVV